MGNAELMTGLGAAASIFLSASGAAVASASGGVYALHSTSFKAFFPIIIAGVLAIYGIIVSVLLSSKIEEGLTESAGYKNFSAGLSVGLACLSSGLGMNKFIENYMQKASSVPRTMASAEQEPLLGNGTSVARSFPAPSWSFLIVLVFLEAIGLYGLIVALFLIGY